MLSLQLATFTAQVFAIGELHKFATEKTSQVFAAGELQVIATGELYRYLLLEVALNLLGD